MKNLIPLLNPVSRSIVAIFVMTASALAHAHAYPTHQLPSAGSTIATTQKSVSIDFDEGLEQTFSSIEVTDARGNPVTAGKAMVDQENKKHLSVPLKDLTSGTYSVAWVALSTDGHRTQGHYLFNVK